MINMVLMTMRDSMTTIMTMAMVIMVTAKAEVMILTMVTAQALKVDICMLMISLLKSMKRSKERMQELKNRANNQKTHNNSVINLLQRKSKS